MFNASLEKIRMMFSKSRFIQSALVKKKKNRNEQNERKSNEVTKQNREKELLHDLVEEQSRHSFLSYYLVAAFQFRKFTHGQYSYVFDICVVAIIIIAGILIGVQTYPGMDSDSTIDAIDIFISILFLVELIMKIISEGKCPQKYFSGQEKYMNLLDFLIVIACLPGVSDLLLGKSAALRIVSKLFRLVRLSKLVNKVPALRVITRGLIGGLKSIGYIALLLLIVLYIYAVLGVVLFRDNDPFFFRNIPIALLTLFHAMTMDSWGDNFRINAYGCDVFSAGLYVMKTDYPNATQWNNIPDMYKCENPNSKPFESTIYFCSFTVVVSLVVLSLFVGVVSMSMQESMEEMRLELEQHKKQLAELNNVDDINQIVNKANAVMMINRQFTSSFRFLRQKSSFVTPAATTNGIPNETNRVWARKTIRSRIRKVLPVRKHVSLKDLQKLQAMREMSMLLMQAWSGSKISRSVMSLGKENEDVNKSSVAYLTRSLAIKTNRVIDSSSFNICMTSVIILAAILEGFEADYPKPSSEVGSMFLAFDYTILSLFVVEIVLRMAAEEFNLFEYFKHVWNVIDFIVVCASQIPGGGIFLTVVRLFRLMRVVKLVKIFSGLEVIVSALIMGLVSIGYVGLIIFLTYYVFAILAIILFKDNDQFNFGSLHRAMFTLYDISTLDNWGVMMYTQIYGCDVFPLVPPSHHSTNDSCIESSALGMTAAAFFVVFILIGALVMLTLFVGVVTTSMEEAARQKHLEKTINTKIKTLSTESDISPHQIELYRRVFAILDLDGGGTLNEKELKVGLSWLNIHPTDQEIKDWLKEMDKSSNGDIDLVEFIGFMTIVKGQLETDLHLTRNQAVVKAKVKIMSRLAAIRERKSGLQLAADAKIHPTMEESQNTEDRGSPAMSGDYKRADEEGDEEEGDGESEDGEMGALAEGEEDIGSSYSYPRDSDAIDSKAFVDKNSGLPFVFGSEAENKHDHLPHPHHCNDDDDDDDNESLQSFTDPREDYIY